MVYVYEQYHNTTDLVPTHYPDLDFDSAGFIHTKLKWVWLISLGSHSQSVHPHTAMVAELHPLQDQIHFPLKPKGKLSGSLDKLLKCMEGLIQPRRYISTY